MLMPWPLAPLRARGPSSIATPCSLKCATALSMGPAHTKHRFAVPRRHQDPRNGMRVHARAVDVQLLCPKPVRPRAATAVYEFRAEHVSVERVGAIPVGDVDDAVIKLRRRAHGAYRSSSRCRSGKNDLEAGRAE
jgi:hypothetical protein